MGKWPLKWRAVLVVGTGNGEPEEIFRASNTSFWPLVTALGTVTIFAAELLKLRLGAVAGAAIITFAVIMWNRPEPPPMTEQEEIDFEAEHGVPVRASGSIVMARWGLGIALLFLSIAFGSFVLAYFYLRIENPVWPPVGVDDPSIPIALIVVGLMVVASISAIRGRRALLAGRGGLGGALAVAGAGGLGAGGLLFHDLLTLTFGSSDHSYGSIFHAFGGFALVVMFIAFVMSATTLYDAIKGEFTERRFSPVDNTVRMWIGSTVLTTGTILVLYASPYLTS